jgi:hypothetical protein
VSPTQRSLAYARKLGMVCGIVEKWNPHAKIRQDLFGCIDIVALDDSGAGPLGIQACAGASHATRRTKAIEEPRLAKWLAQPARFEVWSWSKLGPRGKRKVWTLRRESLAVPVILREAGRDHDQAQPS